MFHTNSTELFYVALSIISSRIKGISSATNFSTKRMWYKNRSIQSRKSEKRVEEQDHYILNYNLNSRFSVSNFNSTGLEPRSEKHNDATSEQNFKPK